MNDKVKAFFKEKGFYISLLVGVIAILAVGIISANMLTSEDEGNTEIAENEPEASFVEEPQILETLPDEVNEVAQESEPIISEEMAQEPEKSEEIAQTVQTEEVAKEEETVEVAPVISQGDKISNLTFDQEKGLLWPISGEVLLPYSMDKTVYFKTLAQYKCNPAMLIAGTEAMEVLCSYDGVITAIEENEETGTTLTMSIGDGYELVYGNLSEVTWQVGDFVAEGSHIGDLASPTKYYVEEGTNLYFQLMDNEEIVDPLLVLR